MEIQVRTALQHLWAELSEKLSDVVDPAVKYGGGPQETKAMLEQISNAVATFEDAEVEVASMKSRLARLPSGEDRTAFEERLVELQAQMVQARHFLSGGLRKLIESPLQRTEGPSE